MRGRHAAHGDVPQAVQPGESRNDWQTLATLLPYLWAYKGRVLFAVACLVAAKSRRAARRAGVVVGLGVREIVRD